MENSVSSARHNIKSDKMKRNRLVFLASKSELAVLCYVFNVKFMYLFSTHSCFVSVHACLKVSALKTNAGLKTALMQLYQQIWFPEEGKHMFW